MHIKLSRKAARRKTEQSHIEVTYMAEARTKDSMMTRAGAAGLSEAPALSTLGSCCSHGVTECHVRNGGRAVEARGGSLENHSESLVNQKALRAGRCRATPRVRASLWLSNGAPATRERRVLAEFCSFASSRGAQNDRSSSL